MAPLAVTIKVDLEARYAHFVMWEPTDLRDGELH
jgi:hypothetical protein